MVFLPVLVSILALSFSSSTSYAGSLMARKKFDASKDSVIVVGAGVSGLAATRALIAGGVAPSRIQVVEKEAQAGGKVMSVEFGGRSYELGAQMIIPDLYHEIEALRDKFGLKTRSVDRGGYIDLVSGQSGEALEASEFAAFSEQLKRYLTAYQTRWHQPGPTDRYKLLAVDGLKDVHPDLKITWYDFIKTNGFELIDKALVSLLGGSGYAYRSANQTQAALIVRVLRPELFKSLFIDKKPIQIFNSGGYQQLWKMQAEELAQQGVSFQYGASVDSIRRSVKSPVKVELKTASGRKLKMVADHVFFTADLSYLPKILSDDAKCERDLYAEIVHSDYRSYLVDVDQIKPVTGVSRSMALRPFINGEVNEEGVTVDVHGQPVLMVKPYADTNTVLVYVHGSPKTSEADIEFNIVKAFAAMGGQAKIIAGRSWKYFPRSNRDTSAFYTELMGLQGRGGLWMSGEVFSFAATHESFRNGREFAELLVQNKLGL